MDRTRLRNKFLKIDLDNNQSYNNLDNRNVIDNKLFRKTVTLFFSDEGLNRQKITLIEKDEIPGNKEISEIFKNCFSSVVAKLNIPKYEDLLVNSVNSEDPLENLVMKYKNHPRIRAILDKFRIHHFL